MAYAKLRTDWDPKAVRASIERVIANESRAAAVEVKNEIIYRMMQPKHGRVYMRAGGRIHVASAPGEFPARDYGKLIRSIRVLSLRRGTVSRIVFNAPYASYLEQGTNKMAPRPFIKPMVKEYTPIFAHRLSVAMERAFPSPKKP